MNFNFAKIILWCTNGTKREIDFLPNKVNVITGGSGTGKTAILQIIDYCFFSSEHKISEDIINENVSWYGIKFNVNSNSYTIARQAPKYQEVSHNYYFSSFGENPKIPQITDINDKKIKKLIETEMSIDTNVKIPGGRSIKQDTQISLKYFMLFNTLSYSVIDNEDVFFDKQNIQRYRDALERIFDLSLGIETIENILAREAKLKLEEQLEKANKKEEKKSIEKYSFHDDIAELFKKSKEFGLIPSDSSMESSLENLNKIVQDIELIRQESKTENYQTIKKEIYAFQKKIDNLKSFDSEYNLYKKNLKETEDSLKPIQFLAENENEIIKTSIFSSIIESLQNDYQTIKHSIKAKTPINTKVTDLNKEYLNEIEILEKQLATIPEEIRSFKDDIDKYIFIGEIKAKLELYDEQKIIKTIKKSYDIKQIQEDIDNITVKSIIDQRKITIDLLEEFIQEDISLIKNALANYSEHKAYYNYKFKKLELRQPHSNKIVNTGSSSIDMFLHLLMFIGLHKVILSNDVPYIAPYLIMDQPSKPYYGENEDSYDDIEETDQFKIHNVFKLLNSFITYILKENKDFQIILFEHVPTSTWNGMGNIHLVEEFRCGNALIREDNKA